MSAKNPYKQPNNSKQDTSQSDTLDKRKHRKLTKETIDLTYGLKDHRHVLFLNALLADKAMSVCKAAVLAGYTDQTGLMLVRRPDMSRAIALALKERAWAHKLDADRVVNELMTIGYSNLQECYDDDGEPIPIKQLPPHVARSIKFIDANGNPVFWDKLQALSMLAKHAGLLDDNINHNIKHSIDLSTLYGREERQDVIETTITNPTEPEMTDEEREALGLEPVPTAPTQPEPIQTTPTEPSLEERLRQARELLLANGIEVTEPTKKTKSKRAAKKKPTK